MKYLFLFPVRLLWAFFMMLVFLVTLAMYLLWHFSYPKELDSMFSKEFWEVENFPLTPKKDRNKKYKSMFHWALKIEEK